jgi:anti-sigma-K factor RskA
MDHEAIEGLIPAYALGATDDEESQAVKAHLASCAACGALLADYRRLSDDLLYATPTISAPAALTERLRSQLARTSGEASPGARWAWPRMRFLAPAFVALVLLLAISNLYWAGRVDRLERQATDQASIFARLLAEAPAIPLAADPSAAWAQGVIYAPTQSQLALLCVYDMPELPPGKAYQLWLIRDGQRDNGGVFQVSKDAFGLLVIRPDRRGHRRDDHGHHERSVGCFPCRRSGAQPVPLHQGHAQHQQLLRPVRAGLAAALHGGRPGSRRRRGCDPAGHHDPQRCLDPGHV